MKQNLRYTGLAYLELVYNMYIAILIASVVCANSNQNLKVISEVFPLHVGCFMAVEVKKMHPNLQL